MTLEEEVTQLREDCRFLLSFVPQWAKHVPEGYGETFYGTLSAEGDRRVKARVDAIRTRLGAPTPNPDASDVS